MDVRTFCIMGLLLSMLRKHPESLVIYFFAMGWRRMLSRDREIVAKYLSHWLIAGYSGNISKYSPFLGRVLQFQFYRIRCGRPLEGDGPSRISWGGALKG